MILDHILLSSSQRNTSCSRIYVLTFPTSKFIRAYIVEATAVDVAVVAAVADLVFRVSTELSLVRDHFVFS